MNPATRTQRDKKQPELSRAGGLDCSESPDMARQEFKNEADVNELLKRFGVGTPLPSRQGEFGKAVDYDLDLQTALAAIAQARNAYSTMSNDLQRKYPSWQRFLNAIERGELTLHPTDPQNTNVPPEQTSLSASPPKTP